MGNTRSKKKEAPRSLLFEKSLTSFTTDELKEMQIKFRSLAKRSAGPTVDRDTFMKYMKFEDGLLGEQLFTFFDSKNNGVVDFEEFICGLAIFSRGTSTQKLEVFFACYDLNGDGAIHSDELATMLGHLPTPVLATLRLCAHARTRIPVAEGGLDDVSMNNVLTSPSLTVKTTSTSTTCNDDGSSGNSGSSTPAYVGVDGRTVDASVVDTVHNHHSRIIEEMVKVAFENCDLNHDGMLSFAQFAVWVERNSDLMAWMSRTGTSSDPQNKERQNSITSADVNNMSLLSSSSDYHGEKKTSATKLKPATEDGKGINSSNSIAIPKKKSTTTTSTTTPASSSSRMGDKRTSSSWEDETLPVGSPTNGNADFKSFGGNMNGEEVLFSGYLWKKGTRFKGWKKRHYRIVDNFLYFFHKLNDTTPSGAIFLDSVFVETGSGDPQDKSQALQASGHWPFQIYSSGWVEGSEMTSKTLYAPTKENRDGWMSAIREASHYSEFEDKYEVGRILGRGHFSTVYVAKRIVDQSIFAVKVIDKTSLSEDENELLRSEIAILKLVHHPNIIDTEQIMESKKSLNIVTELVNGGELLQHIAGRKTLSEEEAYVLFRPVISAVEYLHKMGIIHRDIKPENILCEKGFKNIKVADFGLGKLVRPNTVLARKCGTISYVAPEVVGGGGYSKPADMWSVGIVMHLVLRGKLPFQGEKDFQIIEKIQHQILELKDKSWQRRSPELIDFVQSLLCKEPEDRLTATTALEHVWMKNMRQQVDGGEADVVQGDDSEAGTRIDTDAAGEGMDEKIASLTRDELQAMLVNTITRNQELKDEWEKGVTMEKKIRRKLNTVESV